MIAPKRLLWKLLTINSLAVAVVIVTITLAFHLLAADYFKTLSKEYDITPDAAHSMFLEAVDRYLLLASLTGFVVAILLSLWLNYRLTRPISFIQQAARRIAQGEYDQRVSVKGCGEIDELSRSFNAMAERLQQVDRLRKEFIVDVAHELRTPLTNIRGFTEGLRDGVIPGETAVFETIHEESLRLVHLVEELLQLARADIAQQDLFPESFDLTRLMTDVVQSFQIRLKDRSLTVSLELPPTLAITADRKRMAQVLANIFENALRYSPQGGQVSVQVVRSDTTLRTVVANDVEGTPMLSDALFERFHRGDSSRSRSSGGAGLGLAIVRQLVVAHRGQVGIGLVNGRAEVWFELPNG